MLVLLGVEPQYAAPLGILSVAAGSLAAAPRHLDDGVVHHRLGVTLEITASAGAIVGALLGGLVPSTRARPGARRRGPRSPRSAACAGGACATCPAPSSRSRSPASGPARSAGAYRLSPDRDRPVLGQAGAGGLVAMAVAGLVSGLAGIGGGFIKTPAMNQIMTCPSGSPPPRARSPSASPRRRASLVFSGQGRIDYRAGAAIVVGGVVGGVVGARVGRRLHPDLIRRFLTVALLVIAAILVVTG